LDISFIKKTKMTKCLVVTIVGLSVAAGIFICIPVKAQSAQDLINQMRALQNQNQQPSNDQGNRNTGPSAWQQAVEANNQRIDAANEQSRQGWEAFQRGDYTAALIYFQNAVETDPHNFKPFRVAVTRARAAIENKNGIEARNRGDYANELNYFQNALAIYRCDVYKKNIEIARQDIAAAQKKLHDQQAADTQVQKARNFGETLTVTPPSNMLGFGDPMVVDATKVPSGLPAEVEKSIPQTYAGNSIRKGLEGINAHDWNVALGWFRDALSKQPGDPGFKRMVDLAEYTLQKQTGAAITPAGGADGGEINRALDDYNQHFLSAHPELKEKSISDAEFSKEDPAWVQFFSYITSKLPPKK
jgi:tetratricopeptide (TPR) repeat protein